MFNLTGFQRDLLWVIASMDRPSGQQIMTELTNYFDTINHGRLYPNLDALVDEGLVEKGQKDRRTNYYTITDDGLEMLRERRRWEDSLVDVDV
jgi:DNA-binding PadR family transcriptional regulator